MKKFFIFFISAIAYINSYNCQEIQEDSDSVYTEFYKNYFGSNITPLLSGVVSGRDNFNVKVNFSYKRNLGEKNLRFSMNYLTEGNVFPYDYFVTKETTDTTLLNRYFDNSYNHYDFRFGFEELRGYGGARVHVGLDAIIGFGNNTSNYFDKVYELDSSGVYIINNDLSPTYEGGHFMDFLVTGVDVSFGFDWVMNDRFMFTFQIVPQFNYYIFLKESFEDQLNEYSSATNYADFKLGYFDLMLFYRF
jgi:hypothetical protein